MNSLLVCRNILTASSTFIGKETILMGKVRMKERSAVPDIHESFDFVYDYTYCDTCGSFDVGYSSRLPAMVEKASMLLLLLLGFTAILIIFAFPYYWYASCGLGIIAIILLIIILATSCLRCRKCGNKNITSENVLNFSEGDESVIDVPSRAILKNHIETIKL